MGFQIIYFKLINQHMFLSVSLSLPSALLLRMFGQIAFHGLLRLGRINVFNLGLKLYVEILLRHDGLIYCFFLLFRSTTMPHTPSKYTKTVSISPCVQLHI